MTEKSVFREAWSPEMTSQLFPVSQFPVLSVHWGDLIEQMKKNPVIYTLKLLKLSFKIFSEYITT